MVVAFSDPRLNGAFTRVDRALHDLGLPDQRRTLGGIALARKDETWTPPSSLDQLARTNMLMSDCLDIVVRLRPRRPDLMPDLLAVMDIPLETAPSTATTAVTNATPLSTCATQQPALVEPTKTKPTRKRTRTKKSTTEAMTL